jgi:hypothetical protein
VVARSTLNTRLHYQFRVEREGGRQPVANLLVNPLTHRSAKPIYQLTPVTPTVSVCGLCIDGSTRLTKRNFVRLLCCPPLAHSGVLTPCLADLIADLANILSVIVSCLEPLLHQRKHRARPAVALYRTVEYGGCRYRTSRRVCMLLYCFAL